MILICQVVVDFAKRCAVSWHMSQFQRSTCSKKALGENTSWIALLMANPWPYSSSTIQEIRGLNAKIFGFRAPLNSNSNVKILHLQLKYLYLKKRKENPTKTNSFVEFCYAVKLCHYGEKGSVNLLLELEIKNNPGIPVSHEWSLCCCIPNLRSNHRWHCHKGPHSVNK